MVTEKHTFTADQLRRGWGVMLCFCYLPMQERLFATHHHCRHVVCCHPRGYCCWSMLPLLIAVVAVVTCIVLGPRPKRRPDRCR